jgi:hypothetical protein
MEDSMNDRSPELHDAALTAFAEAVTAGSIAGPVDVAALRELASRYLDVRIVRDGDGWKRARTR